jgi:hypothetical protein
MEIFKYLNIKIFKTLFLAAIIFLPSLAFAALENVYPPLTLSPSVTLNITEVSGVSDYISYFFALGIFIGGLFAVVATIYAGVRMIFAQGNPGEFNKAKSEITRALVGLAILFGAYLILNAVNSNINNTEINPLDCSNSSVCVEKKIVRNGATKIEYSAAFNDNANLNLIGDDAITVKKFKGMKEVWGFSGTNYTGGATKIYSDTDTTNLESDLSSEITINSGIQSIKVYKKIPGIYLYDAGNFGVSALPPLFITRSIADLGDYKNKVRSIQIINHPDSTYYAIVFGLNNFNNGYDYAFYPNGIDSCSDTIGANPLGSSRPSFSEPNSGSVLVFQSSNSFLANTGDSGITAYNIINCYIAPDAAGSQAADSCAVAATPFAISSLSCGANFGDVLSVRLAKQSGVLMFDDNRHYCTFFDINDPSRVSGDCVSSDPFLNKRIAKKFIVIPYEKKL